MRARTGVLVRGATVRGFAIAWLTLACAACGGDDASDAQQPLDYELPVPRPVPPLDAVQSTRATFSIDARDIRYERDGSVVRIPELRLRDVRVGDDARSATLLPARLIVDAPGRPRVAGTLAGRASTDARGVLRFSADAAVDGSAVALDGGTRPGGAWHLNARLDPIALADLHPFARSIPAHGRVRGSVALSGVGTTVRASTRDLLLFTDSSRVTLSGRIARSGARWNLDDVRIGLDSVHPTDWRAWFGSDPIVEAPLTGRLRADGNGVDGIAISGSIVAENADARLAADVRGTAWLEPSLRLDVEVESRGLNLARSGPLDLDVRIAGSPDSLDVRGTARIAQLDSAATHSLLADLPADVARRIEASLLEVDATIAADGPERRRASGSATVRDSTGFTWLVLEGSAPIGASGTLDVRARADSLPLTLLPAPALIENLTGYARLDARVRGRTDAPSIAVDAQLVDARFDVPEYGTGVDSMRTHLRLDGSRIELADVRAFRRDGALTLTGGIDLAAPLDLRDPGAAFEGARVAISALLDTMTIIELDSARAVVAGEFSITGPLERPHVAGDVAVIDGFVYEGKLAPDPPLDPNDPPDEDLLATVPWPTGALRDAARAEAATDTHATPPITADVRATVHPGFRIIDEDSDLGALGGVRLVVDERGAYALGDARIVDGFYAYYGELFQLAGGVFAVDGGATKLAMSGVLRDANRPLGVGQGGYDGLDRRDPPIGIFGYSTPATVLELLRRNAPLPATQPELAALLLFGVPLQPIDTWSHELVWVGDEPADLVGHRSAIQGAGLAWSYVADELYDYVPLERGYLRAGTIRVGSRYPGWIMLGTQLEAGIHVGPRLTARATWVVDGDAWPGVGLRWAFRDDALAPATRHLEVFTEPRFSTTTGAGAAARDPFGVRRRIGVRARWSFDY